MTAHSDFSARCIYCHEKRQPSREHILQSCIGGDLTTLALHQQAWAHPFTVCVSCNRSFSVIDQSLADASFVAADRVVFTPPKLPVRSPGESLFWDEARGLWEEIKTINGMVPTLLPQIHLRDNATFELIASRDTDAKAFIEAINDLVLRGELEGAHVRLSLGDKCTTPRIARHRQKEFYVRARSLEEGRRFLSELLSNWPQLLGQFRTAAPWRKTIPRPRFETHMSICLDDNFRAVAKSAFNLLAAKMGPAFAGRAEFDPLRRYICGQELVHPENAGPDVVLVDQRFVMMEAGRERGPLPTTRHVVCFKYERPTLFAFLVLYGSISFAVRMADLTLASFSIDGHEFTADRSGNRPLPGHEVDWRLLLGKHGRG